MEQQRNSVSEKKQDTGDGNLNHCNLLKACEGHHFTNSSEIQEREKHEVSEKGVNSSFGAKSASFTIVSTANSAPPENEVHCIEPVENRDVLLQKESLPALSPTEWTNGPKKLSQQQTLTVPDQQNIQNFVNTSESQGKCSILGPTRDENLHDNPDLTQMNTFTHLEEEKEERVENGNSCIEKPNKERKPKPKIEVIIVRKSISICKNTLANLPDLDEDELEKRYKGNANGPIYERDIREYLRIFYGLKCLERGVVRKAEKRAHDQFQENFVQGKVRPDEKAPGAICEIDGHYLLPALDPLKKRDQKIFKTLFVDTNKKFSESKLSIRLLIEAKTTPFPDYNKTRQENVDYTADKLFSTVIYFLKCTQESGKKKIKVIYILQDMPKDDSYIKMMERFGQRFKSQAKP